MADGVEDGVEKKEQLTRPCETCGLEEGRYRCPGCNTRSCSVSCVKCHKEDTGCTGKRSMTQYVPLSQYNDSTLLSDYFFLENAIRFVDSTSRDHIKKSNYQTVKKSRNISRLREAAKSRGVTLLLAPIGLSTHKTNSSHVWFDHKTKVSTIHWKVVWNFVESGEKYFDRTLSENSLLCDLLDKYIHPTKSNPLTRHRLRQYVSADSANVKIFMKVERVKGKRVYHELNKDLSLGDNLKGKCIIEHPTVWVTCSEEKASMFPIVINEESDRDLIHVEANVREDTNSIGNTSDNNETNTEPVVPIATTCTSTYESTATGSEGVLGEVNDYSSQLVSKQTMDCLPVEGSVDKGQTLCKGQLLESFNSYSALNMISIYGNE